MYIVLTDHIVDHFEVHYRDIDKLWDCLNVAFFKKILTNMILNLRISVTFISWWVLEDNYILFQTDTCIWFQFSVEEF